jgi:acetyltransferase-like isoleucine patch superfamily enzyme
MKYKGEERKIDFSVVSLFRLIELCLITTVAYALALFPGVFLLYVSFTLFDFNLLYHVLFFCVLLIILYHIFVVSTMLSTAFFINIMRLKYKEGEFKKTIQDKTAFKWFFFFTLYTPTYKLLNIVIIPQLKALYLSMIGCKIGKNVYLAGEEWIADPCMLEIGDNTMIGGRAIITGHLAEDTLILKKVKIGKNCLIGGDTFIMPGAIIEDNAVVGAKSLVVKNSILKKGQVYAGMPVKNIARSSEN